MEAVTISRRFCGPPNSGNGGYVCGRIARHIPGAATVRLLSPPPLETELRIIGVGRATWIEVSAEEFTKTSAA